jgi:hypothetical protein
MFMSGASGGESAGGHDVIHKIRGNVDTFTIVGGSIVAGFAISGVVAHKNLGGLYCGENREGDGDCSEELHFGFFLIYGLESVGTVKKTEKRATDFVVVDIEN